MWVALRGGILDRTKRINSMLPTTSHLPLIVSAAFDLGLAQKLAAASAAAYDLSPMITIESEKTDGGVKIEDWGDVTVLAFRGTRDLKDWAADLRFFKKAIARRIRVHEGFLGDADSLLPRVVDYLLPSRLPKTSCKPLLITGHSLGGALASLAAYFLQREGFTVRGVYTFASPRVGNPGWRNAYLHSGLWPKTFRIARAGDAVPHVPGLFQPLLDGYRHVGNEILLVQCDGCRKTDLLLNPSRVFSFAVDEISIARALRRGDWDFILQFHEISGYEQMLSRLHRLAVPKTHELN